MQQVAGWVLVQSNQAWVFGCPELFLALCNILLWKCNCSVYMHWREQTYCSNSHIPIALLVKNLNKLLKLVLNSFLSIAFSLFSVSGQPGETQSPLQIYPDRNVLPILKGESALATLLKKVVPMSHVSSSWSAPSPATCGVRMGCFF